MEYPWIYRDDAPPTIRHSSKLLGIREIPGAVNNKTIMDWGRECAKALQVVSIQYDNDETPWCGLFAGVVCVRSGYASQMAKNILWAKAFLTFGRRADLPCLGDVLVFSRPGGGGHVGFYVAEDKETYHVLGGNQSDSVSIARIAKNRYLDARRPYWVGDEIPTTVKTFVIRGDGSVISQNEK